MGLRRTIPALPRANEDDAAVHRFMGRIALVLAALAFILAMFGDVPKDVPAWALDHGSCFAPPLL